MGIFTTSQLQEPCFGLRCGVSVHVLHPVFAWVSSGIFSFLSLPKSISDWLRWIAPRFKRVCECVCMGHGDGLIFCLGIYSCLIPSFPRIGSESTMTLIRINRLLKMSGSDSQVGFQGPSDICGLTTRHYQSGYIYCWAVVMINPWIEPSLNTETQNRLVFKLLLSLGVDVLVVESSGMKSFMTLIKRLYYCTHLK